MLRPALLLGLLSLAFAAQAEVFMYRDANGNPVFTDRPGGTPSEPVQLAPTNEWSAPPPSAPAPVAAEIKTKPAAGYRQVEILSPAADTTFRDDSTTVAVEIASEPALQPNHQYRLLVDGQAAGDDQNSGQFALHNLDRGTHQLSALIVNARKQTVAQSASIAIHIKRMSLAQRRQIRPCTAKDYGVRLECPLKDRPKKSDIPFVPFI